MALQKKADICLHIGVTQVENSNFERKKQKYMTFQNSVDI